MAGWIGGVSAYGSNYSAYGTERFYTGDRNGNGVHYGELGVQGSGGRPREDFSVGAQDAGKDGSLKRVFGKERNGKVSEEDCQTCAKRKYQDGSNENVSFKSAAHISPEAAASAVRAHEGEHVSNAYTSAAQKGGKVISASVSIHTSVCPECGRTYVSGGTTSTQIRYPADPYRESQRALAEENAKGNHIDYAA